MLWSHGLQYSLGQSTNHRFPDLLLAMNLRCLRELFLEIFSILTTPLILHFQEQNKILFKVKIIFNIQVMSSSCLSEGKLMIYLLDNLMDLIKDSQVANIECFQLNDSHLYSRSAMNGGHFRL